MLYIKERLLCCLGHVFQRAKFAIEVCLIWRFARKMNLRDIDLGDEYEWLFAWHLEQL